MNGSLEPGAAISEADQARRLGGLSRTPVREALQMLAREGLVEILPKRGTLVARLTARDAREGFELREAVEAACAGLAASRRTDEQLRRMESLIDDPSGSYELGVSFHSLVAEAANNSYLREVFETAAGRIALASRMAANLSSDAHGPGETHRAIYEAIAAGDAAGAEQAMRRHIQHHYRQLVAQLL